MVMSSQGTKKSAPIRILLTLCSPLVLCVVRSGLPKVLEVARQLSASVGIKRLELLVMDPAIKLVADRDGDGQLVDAPLRVLRDLFTGFWLEGASLLIDQCLKCQVRAVR